MVGHTKGFRPNNPTYLVQENLAYFLDSFYGGRKYRGTKVLFSKQIRLEFFETGAKDNVIVVRVLELLVDLVMNDSE